MTEATSIINDALELAGVASVYTPAEPEQQSLGFRVLKGLIAEWIEKEYDISIVLPYEISDDVGESEHLTQTITTILCKRLSTFMQSELSLSAREMIFEAENTIRNYAPHEEPILPDNLPRGQGNRRLRGSIFFKGE